MTLLALAALAAFAGPAAAHATATTQAAANASRGTLTVKVAGLPSGESGRVTITGPNGFRRQINRTTTLKALATGKYRVATAKVEMRKAHGGAKRGAVASPTVKRLTTTVKKGKTTKVTSAYGTILNPGVATAPKAVLDVLGSPTDPTGLVLKGKHAYAKGAILSAAPGGDFPQGLLAHVVSARFDDGRTTVGLRAASIYDVAPNMEFDVPLEVSDQLTKSAVGANLSCGGPTGVRPYRRIKIARATGSWNTVRVLGRDIPIGVRLNLSFRAEAGVEVTAGVGVSCSLKVTPVRVAGLVGPVPVYGTITGDLHAGLGAGGRLTAGGSVNVSAGAASIGLPPNARWAPSVAFDSPQFDFRAEAFAELSAGIGLKGEIGVGVPSAGNLFMALDNTLNFKARPGECSWDLDLGQFSAGGKLLGWSINGPSTPPAYHKNLWRSACGASGSGGGGADGGGGGGGADGGGGGGGADGGGGGRSDSGEANPSLLTWSAPLVIDADGSLAGISCPSSSLCVALGRSGNILTSSDPAGGESTWSRARDVLWLGNDISCPTTTFCVAVGGTGPTIATSANPTGGVAAWKKFSLPVDGLRTVSCPSVDLCVAVGGFGEAAISTDPAGGTDSWDVVKINDSEHSYMWGVSCPNEDFCVASDVDGDILTSTNPTGGPSAWARAPGYPPSWGGSSGTIESVACPSTNLCVAASANNLLSTTDPMSGTPWAVAPVHSGNPTLGSISCPTSNFCVAADHNGNIFTSTAPSGGVSAWHRQTIKGDGHSLGGFSGVSCPTTSLCVASDSDAGNLFVGRR